MIQILQKPYKYILTKKFRKPKSTRFVLVDVRKRPLYINTKRY